MPNIRLMLWGVLAAILFLNYQTWLHDYELPAAASAAQTSPGTAPAASAPASTLADALPQAPSTAPTAAPQAANAALPAVPGPEGAPAAAASETGTTPLHVSTDVLEIGINLKGGELDQADLKDYPLRKDTPNIPVRLLSTSPRRPCTYCRADSSALPASLRPPIWPFGNPIKKVSSLRRVLQSCACR